MQGDHYLQCFEQTCYFTYSLLLIVCFNKYWTLLKNDERGGVFRWCLLFSALVLCRRLVSTCRRLVACALVVLRLCRGEHITRITKSILPTACGTLSSFPFFSDTAAILCLGLKEVWKNLSPATKKPRTSSVNYYNSINTLFLKIVATTTRSQNRISAQFIGLTVSSDHEILHASLISISYQYIWHNA